MNETAATTTSEFFAALSAVQTTTPRPRGPVILSASHGRLGIMGPAGRPRRSARAVSGWADSRWPSVDFLKPTTGADVVNPPLAARPARPELFIRLHRAEPV